MARLETSWWLAIALSMMTACTFDVDESTPTSNQRALPASPLEKTGPGVGALATAPVIGSLAQVGSALRLTFSTAPALSSLRLNRMDRLEGYYKRYASIAVNATGQYTYDDTGVISSHEYCYVVVATEVGQTTSVSSAPACGVFGPPPPVAPTGLAVQHTAERNLELSFIDASSDETSFAVEQASVTGAWLPLYTLAPSAGTGATRSFTVPDLDSELSYCFRVRAVNGNGSSPSPSACGRTAAVLSWPPAPATATPLIATILHPAPGQLTVTWVDTSSANAWTVNRYDGLSGVLLSAGSVEDHRVPRPREQAFTFTGLVAGRLYCFRVGYSNRVCETAREARTADAQREPSAAATPELMAVAPTSNTSLRLTIANPQANQLVEQINASDGARTTWSQDATASSSLELTGLGGGQTYCYRLWTFNQYGSRYSDILCATTTAAAPQAPRNLRVIGKNSRDVTVGWDAALNASSYALTYTGTRPAYVDHDGSRTVFGTSATITGYDQFTYCFRVQAQNAYGSSAPEELCGVVIDSGGVVTYGTALSQLGAGSTTFGHRVAPGGGGQARLTAVKVAGNGFTPYEVLFIRPGFSCTQNPTGVRVAPGSSLTASGLTTLYGAAEPLLPLDLVACKQVRSSSGNNFDSMPIDVTYRR